MNCNCIQEITEKLEEKGYFNPDFSSFYSEVLNFTTGKSSATMYVPIKGCRKKGNGEISKQKNTVNLFFTFCPFCGKEIQEDIK